MDRKYYLKDIVEGFIDRRLPFTNDLYPLLNIDPKRANRIFIKLLENALFHFEQSYPLVITKEITLNNYKYVFTDNFDNYVSGNISESQIELIPEVMLKLKVGVLSLTANHWKYDAPVLAGPAQTLLCKYFAKYPKYIQISDDGRFTDDSFIWGIKERVIFENQLDLDLLRAIKSFSEQIQFPNISISFMNFDTAIQTLTDQVDQDANVASSSYEMWE
jgi:hypothetical protein